MEASKELSAFIERFYISDSSGNHYIFKLSKENLRQFHWENEEDFVQKKFVPLFKIYKEFFLKVNEREAALSLQQLRDELDGFIQKSQSVDFIVKENFVSFLKELLDKVASNDISSIKSICKGFENVRYDNIRLFVYAFAYNLDIPFDLAYYGDFFCLFKNLKEFYSKPDKVKVSDVVDLLHKKQKILYSARHIRDICKELNIETTRDVGRPKNL